MYGLAAHSPRVAATAASRSHRVAAVALSSATSGPHHSHGVVSVPSRGVKVISRDTLPPPASAAPVPLSPYGSESPALAHSHTDTGAVSRALDMYDYNRVLMRMLDRLLIFRRSSDRRLSLTDKIMVMHSVEPSSFAVTGNVQLLPTRVATDDLSLPSVLSHYRAFG